MKIEAIHVSNFAALQAVIAFQSGREGEPPFDELDEVTQDALIEVAKHAIAAALSAWPGAIHIDAVDFEPKLILPLPKEQKP